jgi:hypothetical protein
MQSRRQRSSGVGLKLTPSRERDCIDGGGGRVKAQLLLGVLLVGSENGQPLG